MTHIRPLRSFRVTFHPFIKRHADGSLKITKHASVQLKASSAEFASPLAAWVTGMPERTILNIREMRPAAPAQMKGHA